MTCLSTNQNHQSKSPTEIKMEIQNDTVVSIDYELKDDKGTVIDASKPEKPLVYLHGHGNIIPGLEKALEGKAEGESLNVRIPPEEGYGEHLEQLRQDVPRNQFESIESLEEGMMLEASTPQGPLPIKVVAVEAESVTVDANHPLAGEHLNFDVKVGEIREASEAEKEQGRVAE